LKAAKGRGRFTFAVGIDSVLAGFHSCVGL
jgi:hypothetical protein